MQNNGRTKLFGDACLECFELGWVAEEQFRVYFDFYGKVVEVAAFFNLYDVIGGDFGYSHHDFFNLRWE